MALWLARPSLLLAAHREDGEGGASVPPDSIDHSAELRFAVVDTGRVRHPNDIVVQQPDGTWERPIDRQIVMEVVLPLRRFEDELREASERDRQRRRQPGKVEQRIRGKLGSAEDTRRHPNPGRRDPAPQPGWVVDGSHHRRTTRASRGATSTQQSELRDRCDSLSTSACRRRFARWLSSQRHQAWTAYQAGLDDAPDEALITYHVQRKGAIAVDNQPPRLCALRARKMRSAAVVWLVVREVDALDTTGRALAWLQQNRLPSGRVLKVPKVAPPRILTPVKLQ